MVLLGQWRCAGVPAVEVPDQVDGSGVGHPLAVRPLGAVSLEAESLVTWGLGRSKQFQQELVYKSRNTGSGQHATESLVRNVRLQPLDYGNTAANEADYPELLS